MAGLRLILVDDFGNVRTLSDNVSIGPEQPTNPDVTLWVDTTTNPPTTKYLINGQYVNPNPIGVINVTSLANLPVDSKLIIANITSDQSLSIGSMNPGQEVQIIVSGSGKVTIPSSDEYVNMSDDVLVVDGFAEINIISDGIKKYIRTT